MSKSSPPEVKPGSDPQEAVSDSGTVTVIKGLLLVCAIQFLVLAYFVYQKKRTPQPPPASNVLSIPTKAGGPSDNPHDNYFKGTAGRWGELEYVRINIVSPDDFLAADVDAIPPTQWRFGGYDIARLSNFLRTCKLTQEQQTELLQTGNWAVSDQGVTIVPSEKLVLGLSPEARQQIYAVLAETPLNDYQVWPYTFRPNGFEEWFQNSGVSAQSQALIKRLTYRRGEAMCFSDIRELLAQIPSKEEHKLITRALSRRTGLLAKLRVRPDSNLDALTTYWSRGGRSKDVHALLESLAKVPGGTTVDIAHLLPSFARTRLNTFPKPNEGKDAVQPDCYWTAMNFFKNPPDPLYPDDAIWRKDLAENYTQVDKPTFGDLLFMVRSDGVPYHVAVYIADDVVFTKNGGNHRQPWLLMKVEDMVARYPSNHKLNIVIFTPKNLGE